jgi:hypothetical protein
MLRLFGIQLKSLICSQANLTLRQEKGIGKKIKISKIASFNLILTDEANLSERLSCNVP